MTLKIDRINTNNNYKNQNNKYLNKVRVASLVGSGVGISLSLASISKKNPSAYKESIIKTLKGLKFGGLDVIFIAGSSILGGFIGGSVTDNKNSKAKAKEGISQLIGNYIIPSAFVTYGAKVSKNLCCHSNKFAKFLTGMLSLISGVLVGNSVSKKINENVFHETNNRKLNWKDWGLQFDNVCLVTSLVSKSANLAQMASKAIPIAHFIPGYLTGVKKDINA